MITSSFKSLISKRVVFVTGKGGVGKTTITACLGLAAAKNNKNVLLVELDTEGLIPKFFKEKASFSPQKIKENLSTITIQPKNAMHEYIIAKIKFEPLYKILFENRIIKFFVNAVPGLNEILLIGKIWHLYSRTNKDGSPLYDLIVVDAPSTGHGISFLQVPQTVKQIIQFGPIHEDAKKIETLLNDQEKSAICLVTLPEEMPINEAIDFFSIAKEKLKLNIVMVLVNKFIPKLFNEEELYRLQTIKSTEHQALIKDLQDCADFLHAIHMLNEKNIERLTSEIDTEVVTLPFLFSEDIEQLHLYALSDILSGVTKQ